MIFIFTAKGHYIEDVELIDEAVDIVHLEIEAWLKLTQSSDGTLLLLKNKLHYSIIRKLFTYYVYGKNDININVFMVWLYFMKKVIN